MPEPVEVVFQIDQPGTASTKLKTLDQLTDQIGVTAKAVGVKLDKELVETFAKMSPRALEQINAEMLKMVPAANQAAAAVGKLASQADALRNVNAPLGSNTGAALGGIQLSGGGRQRAALDAEFKSFAAASERTQQINLKNADGMVKLGAESTKAAHGLQQVKNVMLSLAGVPHLQAVESLTQLGGAGLVGPIAVLAGVAVVLVKIHDIFVGIKDESLAILHNTEKFANLGRLGIRGGTDQTKEDFEKLREVKNEVTKLLGMGMTKEAAEVEQKVLGASVTFAELEKRYSMAKERADKLGIDTRDPVTVQRFKDLEELRKKQTSDFNELNQLRLSALMSEREAALKMREEAKQGALDLAKRKQDDFQADFGRAQKLGSLFDEREKLRAGLGGADIRSKNTAIDAEKRDLAAQITEAMLSGREFGTGGRRDLLDRFGALGQTSTADRLAAEANARALTLGQGALASAGGDKLKQGFALDAILAATSNIGSLTSDQVDARLKAIEQKTTLDQDLKVATAAKDDAFRDNLSKRLEEIAKLLGDKNQQSVKITLKDDSGGALKAEQDATPTPESSGVVMPFNQSSAFRNDPLSGRL